MKFDFISFQIGDYCIGIEISKIVGIVQHKKVNENMMQLENGFVISVLDLHKKLQTVLRDTYKNAYYLIFNIKNEWIAVLIDELWGKYNVSTKCLYPLPSIFSSGYIQQVVKQENKLILILDTNKLVK